jgi:hypothetical protein
MDGRRFDQLTRVLGSKETRRRALKMLGGSGLAVLLARLNVGESAAACRKRKKPCRRAAQCCSGRCKKGRCKGNGQPAVDFCAGQTSAVVCGDGCVCLPTVSGAPFCGIAASGSCGSDADCQAVTGPGSACFFNKGGGSECAVPCPNPD